MARFAAAISALVVLMACGPAPTPSTSPSPSGVAVATVGLPTPTPTNAPEPSSKLVRFDVVNGPVPVVVWITSDVGADMQFVEAKTRRTVFVPVFEGALVEVMINGCEIAVERYFYGTAPRTLNIAPGTDGNALSINPQPGIEGPPVPKSTYLYGTCSG